jgi:hypothetical protein
MPCRESYLGPDDAGKRREDFGCSGGVAEVNGIRAYDAARDRVAARLLAGAEALASPGNLVYVHADGPAAGLAVFSVPDAGDPSSGSGLGTPTLGLVYTPPGAPWSRFYRLVSACVDEALARGFRKGSFQIRDAVLLARLQATFTIDAQPFGRDPLTGEAVSWGVEVDLVDALAQLGRVLSLDEGAVV